MLIEHLGDPERKVGKSIDGCLARDSDLDIEPRQLRTPMLLFTVVEKMAPPDVEIVARLDADAWLEPVLKTLHAALAPVVKAVASRPLH